MSQDALREVLRSPLDDLPGRRRGSAVAFAAFLLAAGVGVGIVAGGRALGSDQAAPESSLTTTGAVPETTVAAPVSLGELGVEVAAVWQQGEHLYAVVTTTVLPGADPADTAVAAGAHWVLRLPGGELLTATDEYTSTFVPGTFTVEFPLAEISGSAELLVYPVAEVLEARFPTTRDSMALPWEGPLDGLPYRIGGEELIIDGFRLDDAGGEMEWHLAGSTVSRAVVGAGAGYREVGGDLQRIVAEEELPAAFLVSTVAGQPSARSGLVHLFRLDDAAAPTFRSRFTGDPERAVAIEDLTVEVTVRLYRYSDEPVVVRFAVPEGSA